MNEDNNQPEHNVLDDQLQAYREEQRRKHNQLARESTAQSQPVQHIPYERPTFMEAEPSAPPEDIHTETESDSVSSRPLYPSITSIREDIDRKHEQEEEDARLARQLQNEENEPPRPATPPFRAPPASAHYSTPTIPSPQLTESAESIEEDEELARALQESEQEQLQHPIPAQQQQQQPPPPTQTGGFLSTLGTIGRGLYNAYTNYSQAHQQTHEAAEEQAQEQNIEHVQQRSAQRQLRSDEELARRMQAEEDQEEEALQPQRHVPPPFRFTYGQPRTTSYLSPFGYNSDDEEPFGQFPHGPQWTQLSALNSLLRSTGAPPEEPLFQHLQQLMQRSRHQNVAPMPGQRYVFPRPVFNVQGVENLPPDLLNMMNGESDTSYENLLDLAERMQPVSRGANTSQIDQLPTRTFTQGSMPRDQDKCGICLSEYEQGEELTSLPCLHSFHKECITHWLGINKICPVCRVEIPQTEQGN